MKEMKPEEIEKLALDNAHISTEEILRDIADTQAEIDQFRQKLRREEFNHVKDNYRKLFFIRSRKERIGKQIAEREQFIKMLATIIGWRKQHGA